MLKIEALKVRRDHKLLAYDMTIAPGERVTLQGESGVGKTTLLLCLAGFVEAESGAVSFNDEPLLTLPADRRPVAMLFQEHNLFEHLSVIRNLTLALQGVDEALILTEAGRLGVDELLEKMPAQLSGGQRQRVALLRTLLRPEPVVLLDEPFAELDAKTRELAADWVQEKVEASGKTLILVTHQDEDVARLSQRNIIITG
ncbi:ATP-binding cassette domain-containing protein [Aliamphritea spongicola]|uniref:ATP-binding cassette domain-containing protein n=1 Tax=Aliamphritea spongicola TaxID=707589 RepID=UPI00196AE28B|nr:ATP-binding cassette domain-containing protein [Aliamphritea spongicola]MBN3561228.1 ATP-binding cassette domain-containing protein [Aliamphritea spongicola]